MNDPRGWSTLLDGIRKLLLDVIGSPTDTGGSAATGTVMGKGNAIFQKIDETMDSQLHTKLSRMVVQDKSGGIIANNSGFGIFTFTVPEGAFFSAIEICLTSGAGFSLDSEITIGDITYPVTLRCHSSTNALGNVLFADKGLRQVNPDSIQPLILPKLDAGTIQVKIPSQSGMYGREITVTTMKLYYYMEV